MTEQELMSALGLYQVSGLTEAEREPPEFIVDGVIPVGLTFLSGAPKTRKSFLALQLAVAVARGEPILGFKTTLCDVVYLDLEGSKSRISARENLMNMSIPDNVLISNKLQKINGRRPNIADESLIGLLRALHHAKPNTRLFIIDTYSRARGRISATGGSNAYDVDVAILEPLQQMALEEDIAVLCIHHFKKGASGAADPFEMLSGTMGLSGSCDSVLTLSVDGKRTEGKAKLEYTPRDARGGEMDIFFREGTCEWQRDSGSVDIRGNPFVSFCVNNCPESGRDAQFFSYGEIFKSAYGNAQIENSSIMVRDALKSYQGDLFNTFGVGVQLGVKSNGARGVRLMRFNA